VVHAKGAGEGRVRGVSMMAGVRVTAKIIIMVSEPKISTPLALKSATGDETEPVSSTVRPHKLKSTLLLSFHVLAFR
jgi:hypothetical protein